MVITSVPNLLLVAQTPLNAVQRLLTGAVVLFPNAELMVTVGFDDGPLPVVVTDTRQRAPVPVGVRVAVPRLSGPEVVEAVAVMLLPVPRDVVPARSQV